MTPDRFSEVTRLMQSYFDGLYHADSRQLRQVFHRDLAYICATEGDRLALDLDTYMARVDQRVAPADRRERRRDEILSIRFAGDALAHVQARMTMLGRVFHDELTLLREDGRWQVVTKVFSYMQQEG